MNDESLLAALAEDFIAKLRSGTASDPEEYVIRYPKLAQRIRDLFPTLIILEASVRAREVVTVVTPQAGIAPDSIFGLYRIQREIGRGGMGVVYEAIQVQVQKRVALKVLALQSPVDARQMERFFREARITAGLSHPNIVPVYDVGQVAGSAYFSMRYIEGRGLDRILRLMKPSPQTQEPPLLVLGSRAYQVASQGIIAENEIDRISEAAGRIRAGVPAEFEEYLKWIAGIGIQAAAGLEYAHRHKLIHRDIKPSNLLIGKKGSLWIADFGLARSLEDPALTMSGILLGTPRYMSPEQAEAAKRHVDHRSDIYSLGATLYELLTCRPVFEEKTPQEVLMAILVRNPKPPRDLNAAIPADLETIVMKAMAKHPDHRYQCARELGDDLQRWLKMQPIKARRIGPVVRATSWCRRNIRFAAIAGALALIMIIAGVFYHASSVRDHSVEPRIGKGSDRNADKPGQLADNHRASNLPGPIESIKTIAGNSARRKIATQMPHDTGQVQTDSGITQTTFSDRKTGSVQGEPSLPETPKITPSQAMVETDQSMHGSITSITIRMATPALRGSSMYSALAEMSEEWHKASSGMVRMVIYPDGTQGSESSMVRKMRVGVLAAGMLSGVALSEIDRSSGGLSYLPMMFSTLEEYKHVLLKLTPFFEKNLQSKGFVVLFWYDVGWERFFSKAPAIYPDDFKPLKMFALAGNPDQVEMMKTLGYHPTPMETDEIPVGLRTNRIEAVPLLPSQAFMGRIYVDASNMLELRWNVSMGAVVIKKNVWDKIPSYMKKQFLDAADVAGNKIRASARMEDAVSIIAMQKKGLLVHPVTPQIEDEWHHFAETLYPQIRGTIMSADLFDAVRRLVTEYRSRAQ
jgi:serine/threonine protein kinase/TRAP-type C4-dicarboxylate transport system substrate-binding protein